MGIDRVGGPGGPAPSVWEALAELLAAGQELVVDRIDLARSELAADLEDLAVQAGLIGAASMVMSAGWLAVAAAIVGWLADPLGLEVALVLVGSAHVLLGGVLGLAAARRFRARRDRQREVASAWEGTDA